MRALMQEMATTCAYCHEPIGPGGTEAADPPPGTIRRATLDHLMPDVLGGTDDPSNLVPACKQCNSAKGSMHPDEWLARIKHDLPGTEDW